MGKCREGQDALKFLVILVLWKTCLFFLRAVFQGLQKAVIFGFIFSTVSCFQGFYASGGAKGVGKATTKAVVISLVLILVCDFFLSYFQMEKLF